MLGTTLSFCREVVLFGGQNVYSEGHSECKFMLMSLLLLMDQVILEVAIII